MPDLLAQWDTYEIAKHQAKYLVAEGFAKDEEEALESAFEDYDLYSLEWEHLLDYLTYLIDQRNPDGYWYAEMSGFGWRGLSGEKFFFAVTGQELLKAILPDTDCQFNIFSYGDDGFAIQNFHHDAPTGNEYYHITPAVMCQVCGDLLLEANACPKCGIELCPDCYGDADICADCAYEASYVECLKCGRTIAPGAYLQICGDCR